MSWQSVVGSNNQSKTQSHTHWVRKLKKVKNLKTSQNYKKYKLNQ